MRNRLVIVLILAAAVAAFGGALRNGYVWDDFDHILKNSHLMDFRSALVYFASDEGLGSGQELPYYRPLTMLSFAVDNILWLGWPVAYHATSLALHALTCVLLFAAMRRISGSEEAAFSAAVVFAVHPAHAEPVAYISARGDLLCGLFLTAAYLAHLRHAEGDRRLYRWASVAAFAAALLSKVIAVIFPPFLALHLWLMGGDRKRIPRLLAPYVCVTLAFLVAREFFVEKDVWFDVPLGYRLKMFPWLLLKYLSHAVFPVGLKVFYGSVFPSSIHGPILAAGMLAALAWGIARCRDASPGITLGAAWFFLALLPVSGLVAVLYPAPMADRYLYVPLIGGAVALAGGIARSGPKFEGRKERFIQRAALAGTVLVLAGISAGRVGAWSHPVVLWETAARDAPGNPYVVNRLARAYALHNRFDEAERLYFSVLNECTDSTILVNLAMVSLGRGDIAEAERRAVEAVERYPTDRQPWWALGYIYARMGDPRVSIVALEKFLAMEPDHSGARQLLEDQRKLLAAQGKPHHGTAGK